MDEGLIVLAVLVVGVVAILPIASFVLMIKVLRRLRELSDDVRELHEVTRREVHAPPAVSAARPAVTVQPSAPSAPPVPAVPPAPVAVPRPIVPPAPRSLPPVAAPAIATAKVPADVPRPEPVEREPSRFEAAASEILRKAWSWIIVGDEHRPKGVSMEYAVATNWLIRAGVVVLVCGVGFFLRYSIEHGLIGPWGRVSLSLFGGAVLLVAGVHLLGRRYHLLGQGLIGAGLATLYFAAFAAFSFYHLIGQMPAFGFMALITVVAAVLAVRFDSILVAVLGLAGGYGTPVMLSTGQVQFVGLFSYLLVLGAGMLAIAYRRNWVLINALCFCATYGLFWAALDRHYQTTAFWQVMPFLVGFFVLFSTVGFLHNVVNGVRSTLLEVLLLLLNAGVVFGFGYDLIRDAHGARWCTALAVGLALFYCLHVQVFLSRRLTDRPLVTAFIGLASFFLAVSVPLAFSEQWITLSWSVEAFVLLWMAGRLNSEFLRVCAYVLYAVTLGRFFFMDMPRQFAHAPDAVAPALAEYGLHLLERLVSFGVPVASMGAAHRLLRRTEAPPAGGMRFAEANNVPAWVRTSWSLRAFLAAFAVALFLYLHLEINRSLHVVWPPARLPALTLLWVGACAVVLACCRPASILGWGLLWALLVATLAKLWIFDMDFWNLSYAVMVCGTAYSGLEAGMRLLDFGAVLVFLFFAFRLVRDRGAPAGVAPAMGYTALALLFAYASTELNTFLHFFVPGLRPGGISVLWSCFALAFVLFGTLRDVRMLRYAGLVLFGIVAVKVFFFDLAHLNQLYRIIAFLVLGVLLLAGSFVYLTFRQRFSVEKEESST